MNLILSPSAIRDLQVISDYTVQTWGAEQENRYLKGLWGNSPKSSPTRIPAHCAMTWQKAAALPATKSMSSSSLSMDKLSRTFESSTARWISTVT